MIIGVSKLKEGFIITESVIGLTKNPIVPKNTIVTREIIDVLKAFQIKEVVVSSSTVKKRNIKNHNQSISSENQKTSKNAKNHLFDFKLKYQETVNEYKKEFMRWQSGATVDINKVRGYMIPLFEHLEKEPVHILFLQNDVEDEQEYIFHHAVAVGLISGYLAKRMNFNRAECNQVVLAGCLSDCGMAKVNPAILSQKKLNRLDLQEIRLHPTYSYKMLQNIPSLNNGVKIGVLQHHERIDGSGYPLKEKGERIHLYAKIIGIVDVYHALICNRIYKPKVSPFQAIEIISHEMFGQFDVKVLQTLTSCLMPLSINTKVKLSSDQVGKILFIDQRYPTRPVVQLLDSKRVINLKENSNIKIKEIMNPHK